PAFVDRVGEGGCGIAGVVETCDADGKGMLFAVAEQAEEWGDVDLVFTEIKCVDAHDGPVERRNDSSCEYDRKRPLNAGQMAVDEHLDFSERAQTGKRARRSAEGVDVRLQDVAPPELFVCLAVS